MDALSLKPLSCETERLCLRPLAEGDEALFCGLYTDPETMRFIGRPLTAAEAASHFPEVVRRQGELALDERYLMIVRKDTQMPLGICGTGHYDQATMRLELGMVLLPEGRGKGIATEALAGLVKCAFAMPQVNEVYARFSTENAAAMRVLSSMGFSAGAVERKQGVTTCNWSVHRSV